MCMYNVHCHLLVVQPIVSELPSAAHQSADILMDKHTLKEILIKPADVICEYLCD